MKTTSPRKSISSLIFNLRGQRVMLDADLSALYGVSIRVLNQAVKRNGERFPKDFMFRLSENEWSCLRSQIVILETEVVESENDAVIKPSNSTSKKGRGQHRKYMPFAFTEHGAIMAATVLSSREAMAMSVYVVRAFVQMREQIVANAEILKRLAEIDTTLLKHDKSLQIIWSQLQPLLAPPPAPPKPHIGFHQDE